MAACATPQAPLAVVQPTAEVTRTSPAPSPSTRFADELVSQLTLEQKVAQLLMVGFGGLVPDAEARRLVADQGVGGVCLFKRNIESAAQVKKLNAVTLGGWTSSAGYRRSWWQRQAAL